MLFELVLILFLTLLFIEVRIIFTADVVATKVVIILLLLIFLSLIVPEAK